MKKVTMYTTATCSFCERARQLLIAKKIEFCEIRVDGDAERREEMQELSGRHTVPQIFVGDKSIGGCDDLYELEKQGLLEALLKD